MPNLTTTTTTSSSTTTPKSLFPIPPLIRHVFDAFPLSTYPAVALPARCPRPSPLPVLYIFTTPEAASKNLPSFNPTCLKWQTFLTLSNTPFLTAPATNHASPSGSLPYLSTSTATLSSRRIPAWVGDRAPKLEHPEAKAFLELVETRILDAWIQALYAEPRNFITLAQERYRGTNTAIVHWALGRTMQQAALKELGVGRGREDIYADAEAAWEALSVVLGDDEWFFGAERPGVLEATVFSYAHLILTAPWREGEDRVRRGVRRWGNLVGFVERVRERCGW